MGRPGAVRLHAALRAPHDPGRLADVELLPVTQHEGLALTLGQALHGLLDGSHHLGLLQLPGDDAAVATSTIERLLDQIDWPILNEFKHTSIPR